MPVHPRGAGMDRVWIAGICAAALAAAAAIARAEPPVPDTVVRTRTGLVQGETVGDLRAFRGIPYAAPPVGELRWRPPAPAVGWSAVRDATAFGPQCIQLNASG